jgi:hypothetical protein
MNTQTEQEQAFELVFKNMKTIVESLQSLSLAFNAMSLQIDILEKKVRNLENQ